MKNPIILFLVLLPIAALAQTSSAPEPTLIGAGIHWGPIYDGSKSDRFTPIPIVRFDGDPWFVRTTYGAFEAGARAVFAPGLTGSAQLAYEGGRRQSDSDLLRTLNAPDISASASAGVQGEWQTQFGPLPLGVLARLRQQLETRRGAQADLRVSVGVFASESMHVQLFTSALWADAKSNRTFYGLPGAEPGGGLNTIGAGVQSLYNAGRQWTGLVTLEARRVEGNVSRSLLVERRTSAYVTTGITYRF